VPTQNGATWRGYVGSDGGRYKTAAMPTGVTLHTTASGLKAGALAPGEVPNAGAAGNLCHVECGARGTCDAGSGTCSCFTGFFGEACGQKLEFLG